MMNTIVALEEKGLNSEQATIEAFYRIKMEVNRYGKANGIFRV